VTTVILVRHAATTWSGRRYCGHADPPLSVAGRRAATELATELAPVLPAHVRIVSSPSRRATATAAAIAGRLPHAVIEVDDRWLETDVGLAEGLTFDEVADRFPDLAAGLASGSASIDWPGGERASELERRIGDAWAGIVAAGRPAVVVSHAGSIRVAMAIAMARRADEVAFPEVASWSRHEIPAQQAPVSG
jgi:broad specificity phosphatase PhoE